MRVICARWVIDSGAARVLSVGWHLDKLQEFSAKFCGIPVTNLISYERNVLRLRGWGNLAPVTPISSFS